MRIGSRLSFGVTDGGFPKKLQVIFLQRIEGLSWKAAPGVHLHFSRVVAGAELQPSPQVAVPKAAGPALSFRLFLAAAAGTSRLLPYTVRHMW